MSLEQERETLDVVLKAAHEGRLGRDGIRPKNRASSTYIWIIVLVVVSLVISALWPVPARAQDSVRATLYVTASDHWSDNPGVSHPILHQEKAGVGTYADPVTLSVGSVKQLGATYLAISAGSRLYFPSVRQYVVVEDTYGKGDGVRLWIDGQSKSYPAVKSCVAKVTGRHMAVLDPGPNYPVQRGPIADNGCQIFPDTLAPTKPATTRNSIPSTSAQPSPTPSPSESTEKAVPYAERPGWRQFVFAVEALDDWLTWLIGGAW